MLQQKLRAYRLLGIHEHDEAITEETREQECSYEPYLEVLQEERLSKEITIDCAD